KGRLHLDVNESYLRQHGGQLLPGILFAFRPQQHDDAKGGNGKRACLGIVEQLLVEDDPPAWREALKALSGEKLTFLQRPVMINLPIEVEVGCWERVLPHIARLRADLAL